MPHARSEFRSTCASEPLDDSRRLCHSEHTSDIWPSMRAPSLPKLWVECMANPVPQPVRAGDTHFQKEEAMVALAAATLDGTSTTLSAASIDELCGALRGQLIQPGDDHYDQARRVWNGN